MRRAPLAAALALAVASAGCWDFRDTDERALVLMVGIDRGQTAPYQVSVQIPIPRGGAPEALIASDFRVLAEEGRTVEEALEKIRASLYRFMELGQVKVVIVGEAVAREGLGGIDWLWHSRRFPAVAFLAVAREPVAEVIRARTPPVALPALFLYHAFRPTHGVDDGVVPVERWQALQRLRSPLEDVFLPGVTSRKYGLNVEGVAVFREGRLVGWFSPEESRTFNRLRSTRFYGSLAVPRGGGGKPGDLLLTGGRSRYGVRVGAGGEPVLWAHLEAQAAVRERDEMPIRELEAAGARQLEEETRRVLARLQALGADPLGFGERLRRLDPTHPAVAGPEAWRRAYARAPLEVEAVIRIRTTGYTR
ncbi:Ger(x)C family spore germination protein [Caldinitratiruptor microaerophilus]|uniref:Germination protein GerAC n=1 Tax=Caldinitratiruptor microaerophilus TaxID=671077 RepID=A0AA35CPF3_9FIRM|nr:Ger(x)C family spore germination protein [Caldinitratiruptor microaerophilus]BDG62398.1 germination protein GerAC [Caldinitratiruptor microaerophilus]